MVEEKKGFRYKEDWQSQKELKVVFVSGSLPTTSFPLKEPKGRKNAFPINPHALFVLNSIQVVFSAHNSAVITFDVKLHSIMKPERIYISTVIRKILSIIWSRSHLEFVVFYIFGTLSVRGYVHSQEADCLCQSVNFLQS